jgi:hypothetical protein
MLSFWAYYDNFSDIAEVVEVLRELLVLTLVLSAPHGFGEMHENRVEVPVQEESDQVPLGKHVTQTTHYVSFTKIFDSAIRGEDCLSILYYSEPFSKFDIFKIHFFLEDNIEWYVCLEYPKNTLELDFGNFEIISKVVAMPSISYRISTGCSYLVVIVLRNDIIFVILRQLNILLRQLVLLSRVIRRLMILRSCPGRLTWWHISLVIFLTKRKAVKKMCWKIITQRAVWWSKRAGLMHGWIVAQDEVIVDLTEWLSINFLTYFLLGLLMPVPPKESIDV